MTECRAGIFYGISALLLAAGISIGGYFVGNMMYKSKVATNIATVKGLAEREVKADTGTWSVAFEVSESNLTAAYESANAAQDKVIEFLKKANFSEAEVTKNAFNVNKQEVRDNNNKLVDTSYRITGAVSVRSPDVDKIATAAQNAGELVGQGVMLTNSNPQYLFTKLNDIKPEMLGEATRNARLAAEQFAKDANAEVGSINSAEQGAFKFTARDTPPPSSEYDSDDAEAASIYKKIRVVTTISFYLKD